MSHFNYPPCLCMCRKSAHALREYMCRTIGCDCEGYTPQPGREKREREAVEAWLARDHTPDRCKAGHVMASPTRRRRVNGKWYRVRECEICKTARDKERRAKRRIARRKAAQAAKAEAEAAKLAINPVYEWTCPTCDVPISVQRSECPFCEVKREAA